MSVQRDILVVGAGSAGIAAAIAASRAGATVFLVEKTDRVGGLITHSLLHTLGGFFDARGAVLNPGLSEELLVRLRKTDPQSDKRRIGRLWTFAVAPEIFQVVAERWLAEERNLHLCRQAHVCEISNDGMCWRGKISTAGKTALFEADAVIDATGDAALIRQINPTCVEDTASRAAGGLICVLSDVAPEALRFPKNTETLLRIKRAAADGQLPAECAFAWLDRGVAPSEAFLKLFVAPPHDDLSEAAWKTAEKKALALCEVLLKFLRQLESFRDAKILRTGALGLRDGKRIRGNYQMTENDVREGKRFSDAVCRCAWPLEYWSAEHGVTLTPIGGGGDGIFEVPLSALRVGNLPDAWAAGKCLSADGRAQAAVRVTGTCWATGEAAGCAAARTVQEEPESR
jgi:2-polyprenyl-6-methoxyphenol hydroxylase-like FAD-dependent oxidoreductase